MLKHKIQQPPRQMIAFDQLRAIGDMPDNYSGAALRIQALVGIGESGYLVFDKIHRSLGLAGVMIKCSYTGK